MIKNLLPLFLVCFLISSLSAQHSVARRWNEATLQSIRQDFARPPVHARNLFHISLAMYDAWAAYDSIADTYLLGKTVGNYTSVFEGITTPPDIRAAQEEAMSYAAYRVLIQRFQFSPNAAVAITRFRNLMIELGYDPDYNSQDYGVTNLPADLGNYIGASIVAMGLQDGANEQYIYASFNYAPVNPIMIPVNPGNPTVLDVNRWQPLSLSVAIDQNGNPIPSTQIFQSPEWGRVQPFALTEDDLTIYDRNGVPYWVYHDPGPPPMLDTSAVGGLSEEYKWSYSLVSIWQSHMDPADSVLWDISPKSIGNVQSYPQTVEEYRDFYKLTEGGDIGTGRDINPKIGLPYEPQIVPRADYVRVLAEFWADGPNSETPPGHWYSIMNTVMDHPAFQRRFHGVGPLLDTLEWDVKAYFTLGGAVHDAAVTAWGIKGWYDNGRPITALRYMADKGQSSDPDLPHYHPAGLQLIPGFIELVQAGDTLAGPNNEHVGKIKMYTWRAHPYITNPLTDIAGVGWILAENWWPYQRKTFVTPPFAGYISGHSTYSRAASETLTLLTGDEYFPGGMGEFHITANQFLGAEHGPTTDVILQWATYRDASDQTSLSRIWGGIHPPFDDIPGRRLGALIGSAAYDKARIYFYQDQDEDQDGYLAAVDCDDTNAAVHPEAVELCDGLDNDCNGLTDDNITIYSYFPDTDGDGFGDLTGRVDTCSAEIPQGYVLNGQDCDDTNIAMFPTAVESCDGIDNNCNGLVDDNIPMYTYYPDTDNDGFGNIEAAALDTCLNIAPTGYVLNNMDCNDSDSTSNPGATERCDGLDNNCNGLADDALEIFTYYVDTDDDGFGNTEVVLDTCLTDVPDGYAMNNLDCNDAEASAYPNAPEIVDGLDNDCNGLVDDVSSTGSPFSGNKRLMAYPNPVSGILTLVLDFQGVKTFEISGLDGKTWISQPLAFVNGNAQLDISALAPGVYMLHCACTGNERITPLKIVKM